MTSQRVNPVRPISPVRQSPNGWESPVIVDDVLLDLEETAEFFRVSPETVKYLRSQGRFAPAIKIGRRVMWLREDLLRWRDQQRESA